MNRAAKGFTIIELALAMSFVSMLLIAVAMTVIQISNIYNRGITLKSVNQVGRIIGSEFKNSIAQKSYFELDGAHYITDTDGGRLCTGQYSYIWNYGKKISDYTKNPATSVLKNRYESPNSALVIRFIKAYDANSAYCVKNITTGLYPDIKKSDATELLNNSNQQDLALHSLKITAEPSALDIKTGQQLYNIEFLIGTNDQEAINTNSCKPPNEANADPTYCYINQFNITARSGNVIK